MRYKFEVYLRLVGLVGVRWEVVSLLTMVSVVRWENWVRVVIRVEVFVRGGK